MRVRTWSEWHPGRPRPQQTPPQVRTGLGGVNNMHEKYLFVKYLIVGIANTLVHAVFFFLGILFLSQSLANLIAFFVAASFSFFVNAKFTFKAAPEKWKYFSFLTFMGALSYSVGYLCDNLRIAPAFTFILHCFLSLGIGFLFSKFLFKERGI